MRRFWGLILIGRNLKWSVLIGRALIAARGATVSGDFGAILSPEGATINLHKLT